MIFKKHIWFVLYFCALGALGFGIPYTYTLLKEHGEKKELAEYHASPQYQLEKKLLETVKRGEWKPSDEFGVLGTNRFTNSRLPDTVLVAMSGSTLWYLSHNEEIITIEDDDIGEAISIAMYGDPKEKARQVRKDLSDAL